MTKMTETQRTILSAAARREDGNLLPLPGTLRGGAAAKVIGALRARGLIAETTTDGRTKADAALNRIWRIDADGRAILLHITDAGRAAIGIAPEAKAKTEAAEATEGAPASTARTPRENSKQARMIAMLRAEGGASIAELAEALGWQRHTVHGALSGALKKKLGLTVTSRKDDARGRVYGIAQDG